MASHIHLISPSLLRLLVVWFFLLYIRSGPLLFIALGLIDLKVNKFDLDGISAISDYPHSLVNHGVDESDDCKEKGELISRVYIGRAVT